jgi:hypothetical protein
MIPWNNVLSEFVILDRGFVLGVSLEGTEIWEAH